MQKPPDTFNDEQIIEQAIARTKRSDWNVVVADCRVQRMTFDPRATHAAPDSWTVFMWAKPLHNPRLRKVMPLGCHMQLLDGHLCAVNLYEPSDRQPYLG